MELSKTKVQAHILEQENHILKQELEKTKQVQHPARYHQAMGLEPPSCWLSLHVIYSQLNWK